MASAAVRASVISWLGDGIACDLDLPAGIDPAEADAALRHTLRDEPVDIVVHVAGQRRKKILIADMDSTMIDQECIDELADEIGVKEHVAAITARAMNGEIAFEPALRLIDQQGRLAGLVAEPILGRAAKADALHDISARLGLTPADAIAVGDGANDLDMIRIAGTGVALHAKPAVAAQAGVRIDHGDLTALLYLQGYRQSEFLA